MARTFSRDELEARAKPLKIDVRIYTNERKLAAAILEMENAAKN